MTDRPKATHCPSCGAFATGKFCNDCGSSLAAAHCGQCQAALPLIARFCNECGTAVSASAAARPTSGDSAVGPRATNAGSGVLAYAPWGIAALMLVAVASYFLGAGNAGGAAPAPTDQAAPTVGGASAGGGAEAAGRAPDIAQMTPRERASRLYDRIMRYAEEGKKDSLQFFAPMALASFEMLGSNLDIDTRYDYGRVAIEVGDIKVAAAQASGILEQAPTHLLGLALVARIATAGGDTAIANKSWKQFLAARDRELKKSLPEYQIHMTDIELATRLANGQK